MAETYLGEIRIFAGTYAPRDWAYCNGQLLAIHQYQDLFALIGTTYGGDGRVNFALPDFRGRIPVGMGAGPSLTNRRLGSRFGLESVLIQDIPKHKHNFTGSVDGASTTIPIDKVLAKIVGGKYYEEIGGGDLESLVTLNEDTVESSGGSQRHGNIMPSLCISYIIALKGVYPPRS